jgi:hypothetical protein
MKTGNLQGWYVKRVNRSDIKEFIREMALLTID